MFNIDTIKPEPEGIDEDGCEDEIIIPITKNSVPSYVGIGFAM